MAKPRHTRHGSAGGGRPHRSRSKVRASRFGEGTASRKKSKKPKRRYEHGAHGPEKKRKKRRKSTKKRRTLRFTIRYDKPGRARRRHRPRGALRSRTARVVRPARSSGVIINPPGMTPEIAAITTTMVSRAHRAITPRLPIVPRMLVPKVPAAAPAMRAILPKPPADLAARTAGRSILKTAG